MRAKKIRGLRRRFRQLQRRFGQAEPLDTAYLADHHRDYSRIGLAPWRGLSYVSNPPLRFQREVLQGLLTTHRHWLAEMTDYPEPFHLSIWVFELEFRESEVQLAIREQKTRYEQFFGEPLAPQPPLPELLRRTPGADELRWLAYEHVPPQFYASDWDSPASLAGYLRGRRHRTEKLPDGDTLYWMYRGRVWVGTAPAGATTSHP